MTNLMWKKYKLSDLGTIVGGSTPSTTVETYYGGDIPWLTPKDLSSYSNRYITKGARNITDTGLKSCSAKLLPKGSVLFSSRAPIGYIAIANNDIATNQGFKSIIPFDNNDSLFLYYLLEHNKERIKAMGSGTTFLEVSGSTMKNIEVSVPLLDKQKRIADILGSLDDKIELNNRINSNLESQAQALFKRWFVDFEFPDANGNPYKSSGGEFIDSELGAIPKGWKVDDIENAVSIKGGGTPSTKDVSLWGGDICWATPKDLSINKSLYVFDTERHITNSGLSAISSNLYSKGTVLMSSRAPIGYLAITDIPLAVNQGFIAMVCDKCMSNYYMYLWCIFNMDDIKLRGNGSTFQEISKSSFRQIKYVKPSKDALIRFDSAVASYFEKIKSNFKEINTLTDLRNTLLPKLMNKQIKL